MSYEGYRQCICALGHYWECPEQYDFLKPICPICKEEAKWQNNVDDTNCDSYGVIPPFELAKLVIKNAVSCTCVCGNCHESAPTLYRIPSNDEWEQMRHLRHYRSGSDRKTYIRIMPAL